MHVEVFTTRTCGFCLAAKRLLEREDIAYVEIDVSHDAAKRRWLHEQTGVGTVPQVFVDGVPIGGYRELSALIEAGRFPSTFLERSSTANEGK